MAELKGLAPTVPVMVPLETASGASSALAPPQPMRPKTSAAAALRIGNDILPSLLHLTVEGVIAG